MKKKQVVLITVLLFSILPITALFGQSLPIELGVALTNGDVTLSVSGNGRCAGISIEGKLTNNTSVEISLNVDLSGGLFLENSGAGQDMLATRIYQTKGDKLIIRPDRKITLSPKATIEIAFEAYCADFDKDNPTEKENFSFRVVPQAKFIIASQISQYSAVNLNVDLVKAIQIALWRAEGKSREEIEGKIDFTITSIDWEISSKILSF